MNTYIFTFRNYHTHEQINMQNYFVRVIAESEQLAIDVMNILYRGGYAECVPVNKFTRATKYSCFEVIKQRGYNNDGEIKNQDGEN
jgi:hypothetical protein